MHGAYGSYTHHLLEHRSAVRAAACNLWTLESCSTAAAVFFALFVNRDQLGCFTSSTAITQLGNHMQWRIQGGSRGPPPY